MKPYIAVVLSCLFFIGAWYKPCHHNAEDNRYHHSVIDILHDDNFLYIEGLTRINHGTITHIASLQDESMSKPIILSFKGMSRPYSDVNLTISGTMNLLSVQEIGPAINDSFLSPYLVLNDDPIYFNFEIIIENEVFSLIKDKQTGRTKLLAKR
ncbi:hypothetical protein [Vibrio sp. AND4]|uniref:hypothetical protein n=1 Tax=Vibrio sp. AND4 TaxID=314289 RepID=UPI00015EFBC8|nr:hypothetical protein [Vibrio sp. AND4]EDP59922.1 hypothetical protein AND4_00898 [Vibrio sp. AND4]